MSPNPLIHPQTTADWWFLAGVNVVLIVFGCALPWWTVAVCESWAYHHKGPSLGQRLMMAWARWAIYREARQRAALYLGTRLIDTPHGDAVVQRFARNLTVRRRGKAA